MLLWQKWPDGWELSRNCGLLRAGAVLWQPVERREGCCLRFLFFKGGLRCFSRSYITQLHLLFCIYWDGCIFLLNLDDKCCIYRIDTHPLFYFTETCFHSLLKSSVWINVPGLSWADFSSAFLGCPLIYFLPFPFTDSCKARLYELYKGVS